jgi:hypothetical protein
MQQRKEVQQLGRILNKEFNFVCETLPYDAILIPFGQNLMLGGLCEKRAMHCTDIDD